MSAPSHKQPRLRRETDALGTVEVPADALFGAHTVRAIANFRVGNHTLDREPEMLTALCRVKMACATANAELGTIDRRIADAIVAAGEEILRGGWRDQFPVSVVQGGGGTSTNMNMNEVLANRASELLGARRGSYLAVHPNNHVNRSQSTNDVYPTAMAIACLQHGKAAVAACRRLSSAFVRKAKRYHGRDHLGRTCLQDALPLPIASTHLAQAHILARCADELESSLEAMRVVPLGGTAVGTGLGSDRRFARLAIRSLNANLRLRLRPARDRFESMAFMPAYLAVAAATSRCALHMGRIAQDIRLLSSGPVGGIGELTLPPMQVGSSLMPGKVNPVIPELVIQVSFEIRAAETVVGLATAAGELELNVMEPVIARHLLGALRDLASVSDIFATRCIDGLRWNEEAVTAHMQGSLAGAVEAVTKRGYDTAVKPADHTA